MYQIYLRNQTHIALTGRGMKTQFLWEVMVNCYGRFAPPKFVQLVTIIYDISFQRA